MSAAAVLWLRLKAGVPAPGSTTQKVETYFNNTDFDIQMNDDIFTIQSRHAAATGHTCLPLEAAASWEFEHVQSLTDRGFELSVACAPGGEPAAAKLQKRGRK